MSPKIIAILCSFFIIAFLGYYLGFSSNDQTLMTIGKIKENSVAQKTITSLRESASVTSIPVSGSIVSVPEVITDKSDIYKNSKYWQQIKKDPAIARLYNKTYELYKKSPQAEDIAIWTTLGQIFDSSTSYGEVLTHSLNEINKNKEENFNLLKSVTAKLKPEDSFLRGMMLNLANNVEVSSEEKALFFGSEITRPVQLDKDGKFSPDSLNITTAMIFLKHCISDENEALPYALQSLKLNNDPIAREKLLIRLDTYFPTLSDELRK